MEEAMGRLTNDTGRALAPITGIPFSLVWVAMNYIPLGVISLAIWRFRAHRGDFDEEQNIASLEYDPIQQEPDEADNPYRAPRSSKRVE